MTTVVVRHKVGNIDTWLKGHQDRVELFSKFSSGFQTFQDTDDPNSIVLVAEVFDLDAMQAVMSNPEVMEKIAKQKHTVLDPITVSMPVSVPEMA
jgi:quinol monooxygenase YgiN